MAKTLSLTSAPAATPRKTRVLEAFEAGSSGRRPCRSALAAAEGWLCLGVPVVIPTETVYGLAARALDQAAVAQIFAIKGRPHDNPLIVHVTRERHWGEVGAQLSELGLRLARAFWPGPLTLVVETRMSLPWVTAGLDSIALRHPAHIFAAELIERVGPLAAPSANLSGRPSPTRAAHAAEDLTGLVPLVVDGGALEHGLESTVVDVRGALPILLRPGALSVEAIEAKAGTAIATSTSSEGATRSPGMKYRHYSPRAELWLYRGTNASVASRLCSDAAALRAQGRQVGAIARYPLATDCCISFVDERELGQQLFAWLRELDGLGMQHVLIEGVAELGVGRAVMDRLVRAATRVIEIDAGSETRNKEGA